MDVFSMPSICLGANEEMHLAVHREPVGEQMSQARREAASYFVPSTIKDPYMTKSPLQRKSSGFGWWTIIMITCFYVYRRKKKVLSSLNRKRLLPPHH